MLQNILPIYWAKKRDIDALNCYSLIYSFIYKTIKIIYIILCNNRYTFLLTFARLDIHTLEMDGHYGFIAELCKTNSVIF